ncbi:MAG TPA: dihydrofolate reductase [Casimicrobiaceae bacterium]|nr:dihydrofolate reductase [Casimicrobiaceae bacterium]
MAPPPSPAHASRLALEQARLALVVAVAANGTIGAGGGLPWRLPADLRRFREVTTGHAIVMGRRTWASIGRPLPGRQNIVVTRSTGFAAPGADVAHSLDEALARVHMPPPVFCIGGAELYRAALPRADLLYVTEIARDVPGDTALPPIDRTQWREVAREPHPPDGPDALPFAFVTYVRTGGGALAG